MIYPRILLGTDRLQANDSSDMKSDLQKLATNIITNYSQSIIQKISTSGVKSNYTRTDMGLSDTFSHRDIERKNWSKDDFIKEYMFKPNASHLRKIEQTRAYFSLINSNEAIKPIATADTKFTNLNDYAYEKTLKTDYGDVEVFLDLYDDNDKLGIGKLEVNAFLFNFDSNKDGIINSSDQYFDKLKVRGYDKDGNERILKLSDVVSSGIRLDDFIKKDIKNISFESMDFASKNTVDYRVSLNNSNPYNMFNPEFRYQKIDRQDTKNFFNTYADKDGWVDLRGNNIFNKDSLFNNFAYEKVGFDGKVRLSEFNPITAADPNKQDNKNFSYAGYQRDSFMKFYNDYHKELNTYSKDIEWLSENLKRYNVTNADEYIAKLNNTKSSYMIAMENEFKKAKGLGFSMENLHKIKREFDLNLSKAAAMPNDSDSVVAMKLNQNSTITLKFDSGRELEVRELYSDTGKTT
jgi:response regulator